MHSDEEKNKSMALIASLLIIVVVAVVLYILFEKFIITSNVSELKDDHKNASYCRMVHAYLNSDGKEGHKDYRNIYYKHCLK